ncbi:MAG: RNA polymerase sigma-54 factor, partial [Spirochaetia bacterium]|nr:RNA polymerase sigma-54 factor [Spirochaetia bacterium]
MSLSQNLVQKQTQKLVITQELRQSIELLPMSNLELSEKIHQELLENPLLEDTSLDQNSNEYNAEETENFKLEIDSSAETDIQNSDNFSQQFSSSQHSDSKHQFLENAVKSPVTLKDSLFSQLKLLDLKKEEIHAGEALISDLNEKGFLRTSIEDLSQGLGIPVPTLRKILEQIYCLDPIGCGAKDIHESLSIQAKILIPDDLITHEILLNHFESLEKLDYKTIEKKTGFTQEEIQKSIQIIKKLEPFPGTVFESMKTDYIVPDVIVVERNKNFEVVINDDWIPSLSINEEYVNLMKTPVLNKKDKNYFQTKMESADWLIKSIGQRRKTLFTVMNE